MNRLVLLILMPLIAAPVLLVCRRDAWRRVIVWALALVLSAGSLLLLVPGWDIPVTLPTTSPELVSKAMFAAELLITAGLLWLAARHRKPVVAALLLAQAALTGWFELRFGSALECEHNLVSDDFAVIMALIAGVVGSLICIYALGYMKEFHEKHHPELRDKRGGFFALTALFLSAMFGVVFSNNLLWLLFFWEVTTLCSFLMIGYKETPEAINNAFRALAMNLLGGLALVAGIVLQYRSSHSIELSNLIAMGKGGALLPVALLCFAGLTKCAQLPFSSWLLGAMVAPTPVSALLHSSTMVKAGVYVIVRLAPALEGTFCGLLVALIGGFTFLVASLAAVGQRDAKKILALSTIANLGLIVMCGGVGTYEAVWAAILLIIFHAIAKCLLFLCVGSIEHKLHSRSVEDMTGLVIRMPAMSVLMQVGMAGMFLAPFGMLISKWAALKALVDFSPVLAVFVVFGSAPTLLVWVKWMGKLLEVTGKPVEIEESRTSVSEWAALYTLAAMTAAVCAGFPLLSHHLIEPYVMCLYGKVATLGSGNIHIMLIMMGLVALFPLSFRNYGKRVKVVGPYLAGANQEDDGDFTGSAGAVHPVHLSNYYLADQLPAEAMLRVGTVLGATMLATMLVGALI